MISSELLKKTQTIKFDKHINHIDLTTLYDLTLYDYHDNELSQHINYTEEDIKKLLPANISFKIIDSNNDYGFIYSIMNLTPKNINDINEIISIAENIWKIIPYKDALYKHNNGFILPNGKFLYLEEYTNHNNISIIQGLSVEHFMNLGAIKISKDSFELIRKPTVEQIETLKLFCSNNPHGYVKFKVYSYDNQQLKEVSSSKFITITSEPIIEQINRYFSQNIKPAAQYIAENIDVNFNKKYLKYLPHIAYDIKFMKLPEVQTLELIESSHSVLPAYETSINAFVQFVKNNMYDFGKYESVEFDLNEDVKDEYDNIIKVNLAEHIHVKLIFIQNDDSYAKYLPKKTIISDNIVEDVYIEIYLNVYNDLDAELNSIKEFLVHEYTHIKDDINCRLKYDISYNDRYFISSSCLNFKDIHFWMNHINYRISCAAYLVYRLFNKSETNAFISELQVQLKESDDKAKTPQEILMNTRCIEQYIELKNIIKDLQNYNMSDFNAIYMNLFNESYRRKFKTLKSFKSTFIKFAKYRLEHLFNKLTQAATWYFSHTRTHKTYYIEIPNDSVNENKDLHKTYISKEMTYTISYKCNQHIKTNGKKTKEVKITESKEVYQYK